MYGQLDSFTESNALFSEHALALAERATSNALDASGISAHEVDHIFFTTVTGIGAPSLDALLVQRMGFRADVRRTPSFGLGCVAGAAGIARVADYLKGHPKDVALVISVELCSLTVQWDDRSMANYIGTGLFGDGAATVVMVGEQHNSALDGIRVLGSRSVLYPETQDLIGWKIGTTGFSLMLEAGVPDMIAKHFAEDVDAFLAFNSMTRADVDFWIAHPGGPKILDAFRDSLSLGPVDLDSSWGVLGSTGNMSSAAVLHVLSGVRHQAKGATGLLFAFGPGVSAELVLLEWS
jgi:alkylresorcinol/alkylpyrone synthase